MIGNSRVQWGSVSRAVHWGTAVLLLVQVPLGLWMVSAYDAWLAGSGDPGPVMRLARAHNTLGFLMLLLVTARLAWRGAQPTPAAPPGLLAWQRLTARATHALLYVLLFAFPLSGWAALSAYDGEFPIFFFGWDNVFRLVPQAAEGDFFNADFFGEFHESCWKIGAAVLALHVVGALWHEYVRRDGLLTRMRRGRG